MFEVAQVLGKVLQAVVTAALEFWIQTSKITWREQKNIEANNSYHLGILWYDSDESTKKKTKKTKLTTVKNKNTLKLQMNEDIFLFFLLYRQHRK